MLATLELVQGAVGTKTMLPILSTFHIYNGRIQGANGRIAIDAACSAFDGMDVTIDAERFINAVRACAGEPTITQTPEGKIAVRRGRFRSLLARKDSREFPRAIEEVQGERVAVKDGDAFIEQLARLRPFVSDDASRPWSLGVLLRGKYAYATNNIIVARERTPVDADVVIPVFAIDELLRIGKPPESILWNDQAVQFNFGTWWMRSQRIVTPWPNVEGMYSGFPKKLPAIPDGLREAIEKVAAFVPDIRLPIINFGPQGVETEQGDYFAAVEGYELPKSSFRVEPLMTLLPVATHMDLSPYPDKCPWRGEHGEGFLVGVKR